MKLNPTDWKHAWFESHISDRFFQEMSKLERGTVLGLGSSAQWMQQITIEMGQLAQVMIRLESEGAPELLLRQASEKATRLAALSLYLMTALDAAERAQRRAGTSVAADGSAWSNTPYPLPPPEAPGPAPAPAGPPSEQPPPAEAAEAPPLRPAPAPPAPAGLRTAAAAGPDAPPAAPQGDVSLLGTLVQVSGRNPPRTESALRQTIVSLSEQGLSRAEIEMVIGEPRHVIEAVLNHARTQSLAQGRSGQRP